MSLLPSFPAFSSSLSFFFSLSHYFIHIWFSVSSLASSSFPRFFLHASLITLFYILLQGKRTAGIGVQFSEQDRGATQRKIEAYLAGAVAGEKATHTM